MHIPDGFLSAPVWASLDAAALAGTVLITRRAQSDFDDRRAPLLGVMGAFVFAAQMINFPVGAGTSGHLVGSALLAMTLRPAAAAVVMTAILAIQALVFQDGGILALGANVFNMAIAGMFAGYLPCWLWGRRRTTIFAGAFLSVLMAALLAVAELLLSGVRMPAAILGLSLGLFVVSAVLEAAITVAVFESLAKIQPGFREYPASKSGAVLSALGIAALLLAAIGVLFASADPDGLERLAERLGIAERARTLVHTPLADYEAVFLHSDWLRKASAGLAGLALIYAACLALGRLVSRSRQEA